MTTRVAAAGWGGREAWLSLLEELFDPSTVDRLQRIGVAVGWNALEVGAGRGSIAEWLARRVGPGGHVVATDVETRFLDRIAEPNLESITHDVLTDDFPEGSFDLVHCRATLVHLADPERAVRRLAGWLKPGGVMLAEEPWLDIGLLSADPMITRAVRALKEDVDGGFAPRLPQALTDVGLERVEAEGKLEFFPGGTKRAGFFRHVLEGASIPLVAAGEIGREEVTRMTARYEDRGRIECGWPRIAAWGWKPR